MAKSPERCPWPADDLLMILYHDTEWGVPVYDDRKFFEFILLDAFQAGLSWKTILHKRENFRQAFDGFDFNIIAGYDRRKIELLLKNKGIIRNRLKVESTVKNAQAVLRLKEKQGSLSDYLWSFTGGKPIVGNWKSLSQIPPSTTVSDRMSKSLKKEGFSFVGSTICYSFMQAAGLVNDHLLSCPRHREILSFAS